MPSTITQGEKLAPHTTLGIGGKADYFARVSDNRELKDVLTWAKENNQKVTILGGGSNVLISDDGIRGLVLNPAFKDITYSEIAGKLLVNAGAGLLLDEFIQELVSKELWGLENLTNIPGTVGAVPIQNVGAYGVEGQSIIHSVHAYDMELQESVTLTNEACAFEYRDSIFKKGEGKKYIVTDVVFEISKTPNPNIEYKDLQNFFKNCPNPSIQEIRDAVCTIRSTKFPNIEKLGTVGSFFKNPIISKEHFKKLKEDYPEIVGYKVDKGNMKVSLGLVLDHICNLRGYKDGDVWLHEKQALVLVCKKGISSEKINKFAEKISDIILEKTGISISREVTLL